MARPRLDAPNYRLTRRGSRFYVRWWEGGAWQRVSTGTDDRREAQIWLAQFIAGRGTPEPPAAPTVSAILDAYLAERKGHVRGYATLEANAKALRRHLGNLQPDHVTKERIRFYRRQRQAEGYEVGPPDARRKKPVQDGTILREMMTLRAAMAFAVKEKWIAAAPHIEAPPHPPPRTRWLTRDEAGRLISGAKALHIRTFLSICLYTAARGAAVLELTWDRVDFDAGLIDLGEAPGGKGRSVVPIATPLRPILEEAKAARTCRYVIEYAGEKVGSVKTGTRAAAAAAGLPGVTPHILRHTAATWMAQAGVPIDAIARVLGHSNSRITWKVYAKYQPGYLRSAIDALSGPDGTGNAPRPLSVGAGISK